MGIAHKPGQFCRSVIPCLLACAILLAGCRSSTISVNPQNKRTPQYPYRKDELALLQIATDDIFELEKTKDYSRIYDRYASADLKRTLGRRRFLKTTNCAETTLGGLMDYDKGNLGFTRTTDKNRIFDSIVRDTDREEGSLVEKLVFVQEGVDYKLYALYWDSKRKDFVACLNDARKITAPQITEEDDDTPADDGKTKTGSLPKSTPDKTDKTVSPGSTPNPPAPGQTNKTSD